MNIFALIIWLIIAFIPAAFGQYFTLPNIPTWYATLNKPVFNPPNWIFGPVWTLLYISMGIAAYLVWQKRKENKLVKIALIIFFAQLFINGLWSLTFFGQHQLLQAFFQIIMLWFLILATIIKFYQINSLAGLILIPYLLWVSFASILNYSIWLLNK
ncbi:MAG: tryptophan-rich sensory protein [Candidatus Margulisbacteria bacterium]|nr:tryptophan-rich sensory protein [Candidatus Margulisiibacteriota bacterium]